MRQRCAPHSLRCIISFDRPSDKTYEDTLPKQPRPSASRRPRQKARRRAAAPPPPAAARPRVAPLASLPKGGEQPAPKPRVPGMMDFSYLKKDLRRIVVISGSVFILLLVLSFVLR